MGMSASQARLIALTERMNDIEYQGQQINQQRTTLSNQVNALYNSLLDMDVPTPPSTSDYTKTQYSGTLNASKFQIGVVTPNGIDANGQNLYNINLNFTSQGLAVEESKNTVTAYYTPEKIKLSKAVDKNNTALSILQPTNKYVKITSMDTNSLEEQSGNTPVYVKVKKSVYDQYCKGDNNIKLYTITQGKSDELIDSTNADIGADVEVYAKIPASKLYSNGQLTELAKKLGIGDAQNPTSIFSGYDIERAETKAGAISDADIKSLINNGTTTFYIEQNGEYVIATADNIKNMNYSDLVAKLFVADNNGDEYKNGAASQNSTFSVKSSNKEYNPIYDTLNCDAAKSMFGTKYNQYITALHNSFPEIDENDIPTSFAVYFTQEGEQNVPHFIKTTDMATIKSDNTVPSVAVYEFDEDGTYADKQTKEGCYLEFDADGQITKVGIPKEDGTGHTWVKLEVSTVSDDAAYKDAFNKYEYDKAVYDKKQQEINAKTSIIQSEDKSLELKLTRLDNERNAVNTELEAVKKVVNDNIQKSFKTFNG